MHIWCQARLTVKPKWVSKSRCALITYLAWLGLRVIHGSWMPASSDSKVVRTPFGHYINPIDAQSDAIGSLIMYPTGLSIGCNQSFACFFPPLFSCCLPNKASFMQTLYTADMHTQYTTPSVPKYKNIFNTTLVSKTFLYYGTEGVQYISSY